MSGYDPDAVQYKLAKQRDEAITALTDAQERIAVLEAALVAQRVLGHGEGQEHTIADVNAGKVDDLIRPRLDALLRQRAQEIEQVKAAYAELLSETAIKAFPRVAELADELQRARERHERGEGLLIQLEGVVREIIELANTQRQADPLAGLPTDYFVAFADRIAALLSQFRAALVSRAPQQVCQCEVYQSCAVCRKDSK